MARQTLLFLAVLLCSGLKAQSPPALSAVEFPYYDTWLLEPLRQGKGAAEAARALERDPEALSTFILLLENRQPDAAIGVLEAIVARHPDQISAAVVRLVKDLDRVGFDDEASGRLRRLRALVQSIKAKLPSLPREDAAWIDYTLISIDARLQRTGSGDFPARLRRIEQLYPGTAAARSAEVDHITRQEPTSARVEALETFARSHPGTVEGAKALWHAAFDIGHNLPEDKEDEEPSGRFAKVFGIARELESGRWPASEWVTRAPSLVIEFFAYKPRHTSEGIRRMVDLYREFVDSHFTAEDGTWSSLGYVITTKIPELLEAGGDTALAGMEPIFEAWARKPGRRDALRFARAEVFEQRRIEALTELAASGGGLYQRKALAELASLYFHERDFAAAAKAYEKYLNLYPRTDWAWAARLRLGQTQEQLGNWPAASAAYRSAAMSAPDNALAKVLGFANAARSEQALEHYDEALRLYRSAREAWDPAYAHSYGVPEYVLTSPLAGDDALKSAAPITKEALDAAIEKLEIATTVAGGDLLAQGRAFIDQGRWTEGRAALERFLARYPQSPHTKEARYQANLAQLQEALDRADAESASSDPRGALAILDTLATKPWDPAVGVARIARASLFFLSGDASGAEQAMRAALTEWHVKQIAPPGAKRLQGVDEDVAEIRKVAFRPAGGDPYTRERRWEAFPKSVIQPFATVKPELPVKLSDGSVASVRAFRAAADVPPVLFFGDEQIALLGRVAAKLGGTRTRQPGQPWEVPNQPVGGSRAIVDFWNRFFNAVPGHWGGWMFESPPTVTRIEFLNAERTKASAFVTIRYEGATLVMEKIGGIWKVTGITNRWIT